MVSAWRIGLLETKDNETTIMLLRLLSEYSFSGYWEEEKVKALLLRPLKMKFFGMNLCFFPFFISLSLPFYLIISSSIFCGILRWTLPKMILVQGHSPS